jgi:cation transport ATPase
MEHKHQPEAQVKEETTDHSKMNHSAIHHGHNPSMGMEGHNHAMMIADFKRRFYIVLILTIPIVLLSTMIQKFIGVDWDFKGSKYILFALSSVVFFYGGWPFFKGLVIEVKTKSPGMMFLIGFAITVAFIYSVAIVFGLKGMDFFWELATLILIMLLGHWIEMKSIAGASKELELLVQLMPSDAHMVMPDMVHEVKTDTLKENDIILVKPGEKVAADGFISEGESYLNESMLTGESKPVRKTKGDGVNDAPALAQADVGIAVGSGSDIAAETAGIILVNSNPKDIVSLILFGKATYHKMIQNLIWATGYNVIALPLAAGVLYKLGILLSPAAGAVLMTASTIVVAINASLLKVKN